MAKSVNLDIAKRVDITCRRGDTFLLSLNITNSDGDAVDLSVFNGFKMEVRVNDTSDSVYADGNSNIILSTQDDENGDKYISVPTASAGGELVFQVSAANMAGIPSGLYVYDIEATDEANIVSTWITGIFKVNEDVSV